MCLRGLLLFAWIGMAVPVQAIQPSNTCAVLLAAWFQGAPLPSVPRDADLSDADASVLIPREERIRRIFEGAPTDFWSVFDAISERESFFSIRAGTHYGTGFDEDRREWVDEEDSHQFEVFSSRALVDQNTLLQLLDAHEQIFGVQEHARKDFDDALQAFLENVRRRFVLMGIRDARLIPLVAHNSDGTAESFPSVQWDFPADPKLMGKFIPHLPGAKLKDLIADRAILAVAPRLHAKKLWLEVSPDGRPIFVLPWQNLTSGLFGSTPIPPGTGVYRLQFHDPR